MNGASRRRGSGTRARQHRVAVRFSDAEWQRVEKKAARGFAGDGLRERRRRRRPVLFEQSRDRGDRDIGGSR